MGDESRSTGPCGWMAGLGPKARPALALVALILGIDRGLEARGASSSPIQIMPLGDSITFGYDNPTSTPGGYRSTLYKDLTSVGYNVQMVGSTTENSDPSLPAAANSHEGHPGFLIAGTGTYANIAINGNSIDQWLAPGNGVNPNLVLLEVGTNEILGNYHVQSAPFELAALVTHILELRPKAEVLVSTISPLVGSGVNAEATAFNKALSGPNGIVAQLQATGENVQLVNAGGSLTVADLSSDGIHPSAEGYAKLGTVWASAVEQALLSPPTVAPEPSTLALFGVGSLALIPIARARARARAQAASKF